jgi:hypothetical protein
MSQEKFPFQLPPRCLHTLTIGKSRSWIPESGKYKVCVTPTMQERLFPDRLPPHPLGCGVFACAYPHKDRDKVVKITSDPADVGNLQHAQGLPRVPKLYETYEVRSPHRWSKPGRPYQPAVYAMVLERLRPLDQRERRRWARRINWAGFVLRQSHGHLPLPPGSQRGGWRMPAGWTMQVVRRMMTHCPRKVSPHETALCRALVVDMTRTYRDLLERGIAWRDIHAGNVGLDEKGRWKVLDLGFGQRMPDEAAVRSIRGAKAIRSAARFRRAR